MVRLLDASSAAMLLVGVSGFPALAEAVDLQAGQEIASQFCARCHAIGLNGPSPHPEAPPFRTFRDKWPLESLEEALAEGIVVGHPDMPELSFDPDEIFNLLGYIETLR